jgi:acetyltransferase-like isoleucine patch superfamily enzyme
MSVPIFRVLSAIRRLSLAKLNWYRIYYLPLLSGRLSTIAAKLTYGKAFSIKGGSKAWGRYRVLILGNGTIEIGMRFHCVSDRRRSLITLYSPVQLTAFDSGSIAIGDNVGLNGTAITSSKRISIGDETMIAPNTIIVDTDFHNAWPPEQRWSTRDEGAEISIGKRVWIGMNVTILKGVKIGDNSVIAAGSVVVHDIEADCLAAGNPARKVKSFVAGQAAPSEMSGRGG